MDRRELYTLTGSIVRVVAAAGPSCGDAHLFSVESAAGTTSVLRPCDRAAKEFAAGLGTGDRLRLTVGSSDGVYEGTLVVDRWLVASRMLMVDNPPLSFAQRRDFFRVQVALALDLALVRGNAVEIVECTTGDVSQGGCSIVVREPVAEGELAGAVIHLEERSIAVVVQVLGVTMDRRLPVRARFDQITPHDRNALATELRRHEVARVRTGRLR